MIKGKYDYKDIIIYRGANIVSHEKTSCLVLHKDDYRSVIYHVKMI
jgi:hypothetical protein